jgi:hypothetical protein
MEPGTTGSRSLPCLTAYGEVGKALENIAKAAVTVYPLIP